MRTSSIVHGRTAIVTAALAIALGVGAVAASDPASVTGPRPLAQAIAALEARTGWRITYEDRPYLHAGDLVDVTRDAWPGSPVTAAARDHKPATAGAPAATLVPKGGRLALPPERADADAWATVVGLVDRYNAMEGGRIYSVVRGRGVIHVVPQSTRGPTGRLQRSVPVFDTPIAVRAAAMPASDVLAEVCAKVSASAKVKVTVGTTPFNLLAQRRVTVVSAASARAILDEVIEKVDAPLSWTLVYDPVSKGYVLNIERVRT